MNKISAQAIRLIPYTDLRPQADIDAAVGLFEDVASVGRSIIYINHQQVVPEHYREMLSSNLEDVAIDAIEILYTLGVDDAAEEFAAEYERASKKHPDMTLDSDNHTDESRFYALAEEAGEVCAALTYDNKADTGHNSDLVSEVTQVGGLALAWLTRIKEES